MPARKLQGPWEVILAILLVASPIGIINSLLSFTIHVFNLKTQALMEIIDALKSDLPMPSGPTYVGVYNFVLFLIAVLPILYVINCIFYFKKSERFFQFSKFNVIFMGLVFLFVGLCASQIPHSSYSENINSRLFIQFFLLAGPVLLLQYKTNAKFEDKSRVSLKTLMIGEGLALLGIIAFGLNSYMELK